MERRLAAIPAADVVGFSRHMGAETSDVFNTIDPKQMGWMAPAPGTEAPKWWLLSTTSKRSYPP